jgi:hypothetical protein
MGCRAKSVNKMKKKKKYHQFPAGKEHPVAKANMKANIFHSNRPLRILTATSVNIDCPKVSAKKHVRYYNSFYRGFCAAILK